MKEYIIKQFIIYGVKNGYAIQNESSFTVIKDKKLIEFFILIDRENRLIIKESFLQDYFGQECSEIIEFLIDSKLIEEKKEKKPFQKICIYTNDEIIYDGLRYFTDDARNLFEINCSKDCKRKIHDLDEKSIDYSNLFLIILNPFDYKDFVEICDKLRQLNVLTLICFAYNSSFYMTNLYKKEWYNPCPKCFLSNLETSLRAKSKLTVKPTFQTIVDLIYSKELSFQVSLPTRKDNIVTIINEIVNYRNNDINYLANRIAKIKLDGNVEYDQCCHWELCDCFE